MDSIQQTLELLRARRGIDVSRQKEGTSVIVEAGTQVYHLRLLPKPSHVLVEFSGTDPRLRASNVGQFLGSQYDPAGKVFLDHWIGEELCMVIRFKNGTLMCPPTKSASVIGENYKYDVF